MTDEPKLLTPETALIGNVYYADDPEKKIFRRVYPLYDNAELDHLQWVVDGCDPNRDAIMEKVPATDPRARSPITGQP